MQVVFPTPLTGYIITAKPVDTITNALVLKTIDGGYHWYPILFKRNRDLTGIDFISRDTGVIISSGGYDTCYKTFDGGSNWIKSKMQYDIGNFFHMASATKWVYLRGQHWGHTDDGGATWVDSTFGNSGLLPIITSDWQFIDNKTVIGFGDYAPEVFKSIDGGLSWPILLNNAPSTINTGCFPAFPVGYYASNYSGYYKILKTIDGGQHWTKIDSSNGSISCIRYIDANNLYAIGSNGIAKSIDAGNTWTQETTGTTQRLSKIIFLPNKAIVIGDSGTILMNTSIPSEIDQSVKNNVPIQAFPNPCPGKVHISTNMPFKRMVIYNAIGKEVFIINDINTNQYTLDLSNFIAGVYFIEVFYPNLTRSYVRIVKTD
ncbi:MAG: T9SS type A sorting domain-containing protein [Taibaiella sp.]|nr:T9SS type A sorting domain-containing protein [Taibaiella sp.]